MSSPFHSVFKVCHNRYSSGAGKQGSEYTVRIEWCPQPFTEDIMPEPFLVLQRQK